MPCQNSLLSEQLLLDISHEKGLMFNAKLTYLKIFHATPDFDLAEGYDWAVKSQYKQNIAIQHTGGSQCKYDSYYWSLCVCYDGTGYPQSPGGNIYIESSSSPFLTSFCCLFLYPIEQITPFLHASKASSGKHSHSGLIWEVNKIK